MKAAWDRCEDCYDPARKEDILGRTKTRLELWEEHLKDPITAPAESVGVFGSFLFSAGFANRGGCNGLGAKILQQMWEGPCWEGVLPWLDPWDVVLLRTSSSYWNVLQKYGPHSELFFFLIMKEPEALTKAVPLKPVVPDETLKARALIGPHLSAAEGEAGSSGSQSPDLETCGDTVARKALTGMATLSHGQQAKALLHLSCANTTWKALL